MSDGKYFRTTKKGEIFELKSLLNSNKKKKKNEALKKVIFLVFTYIVLFIFRRDYLNCV